MKRYTARIEIHDDDGREVLAISIADANAFTALANCLNVTTQAMGTVEEFRTTIQQQQQPDRHSAFEDEPSP